MNERSWNAMSFIYGFQCGPFIKIGISRHVERRLDQMKLYNPYKIKVALKAQVLARHARLAEICLHRFLEPYAVGREWFFAPPMIDVRRFAKASIQAAINVERRNLADYDEALDAPTSRGMDGECLQNDA